MICYHRWFINDLSLARSLSLSIKICIGPYTRPHTCKSHIILHLPRTSLPCFVVIISLHINLYHVYLQLKEIQVVFEFHKIYVFMQSYRTVSLNILRFIQAVVYRCYLFVSLYSIIPVFLLMSMFSDAWYKLLLGILSCHTAVASLRFLLSFVRTIVIAA